MARKSPRSAADAFATRPALAGAVAAVTLAADVSRYVRSSAQQVTSVHARAFTLPSVPQGKPRPTFAQAARVQSGPGKIRGTLALGQLRREPLPRGFAQTRAIPPDASVDVVAFNLASAANDAVASALQSSTAGGATLQLVALLFAAGVASSLNPCSAAALPAAAATVAVLAQGEAAGGVALQSLAFAAGSGTVLAALGFAAALLGEQLLLAGAGPLQWSFPCLAVLMGLSLLGALPVRLPGLTSAASLPSGVPRGLQSFALGMVSAAGSSPCATPVLVTVLSFLAANPQGPVTSAALLLSYALGYSSPLAVVSASAGSISWLQSGGQLGPLVSGAAILAVGTAQLASRAEAAVGGAGGWAAAALILCLVLVAYLAESRDGAESRPADAPARFVAKVTPLAQGAGMYRYAAAPAIGDLETPAAGDESAPAIPDALRDGRRVALAAICVGSALSGTLNLPQAQAGPSAPGSPPAARSRPEDIILQMAASSPRLSSALRGSKPVLVDFSATWCPDCITNAPLMRSLEQAYGSGVQFVTLDVSYTNGAGGERAPETDWWLSQFRVDGIPHVAFVEGGGSGRVLTSLIGAVPEEVLRANIEALRDGAPQLPYVMYDAFDGGKRRLQLPIPAPSSSP